MSVPDDAAYCSCAKDILQILRNADSSTVDIVLGTRNIAKFDLGKSQQDEYYGIVFKMLHSESCWISMAAIDGIERLNYWTIEQRQSFLSVLKELIAKKRNYQQLLTKYAIKTMKKLGVSAFMFEKELIENLSSAVTVAKMKGTIVSADICIALNNTAHYLSYSSCLLVVELFSLASLAKAVKLADRTIMQQALNDFLASCPPSTCSLILLRLMRMLGDRKVLKSYAYISHIMATVKNNIRCVLPSHIVQILPHVIIFTDGSQFYTVCGIEHHDCGVFHTVTSQKHIPDVLCDEILSYLEVSGGLGSISKSFCETAQHSACSLVSRLESSQLNSYLNNIVLAQPNRSKLETILCLSDHLLLEIDTAHAFQLVEIVLDKSFIILQNITPSLQSRLLLKCMPIIPAQYYVECLGCCLPQGDRIADDKQLKSAVQVTTDTIANRLLTPLRAEHITSVTELLQLKLPVTVTSPIYAAFSLQFLLLVAEKFPEVELEPLFTIAIALQDLVNYPKRQVFTGNLFTQLSAENVQKLVSYLLSTSRNNTKEMYVLYCLLNYISTDQFTELMSDLLLQYPLDKLRQMHMSLLANGISQLSTAHMDILTTQFIPHLTAVCAIDVGEVTISEFIVLFELIAKLPASWCTRALAILFQLASSVGFEHQFLGRALEKSIDMCASQSPDHLLPILLTYVKNPFDLARSKAFYGLQQFSGDVGTEYMEMMLRNLGTVHRDNASPLRAYELQLNLHTTTESQRVRLFSTLLARTVVKYSFKLVRTDEIELLNVDEIGFYLPDIQCDVLHCTLKYRDTVALSVAIPATAAITATAISQPLYDMLLSHLRELAQPTAGSLRHSSRNVDGWKFHTHMGELEKFALNLFPLYPRDTDRFIVSALGDLVQFIPATMYGEVKLCLLTQWGRIIFTRDIVLTVMNKIDAFFAQHHVEALVSGLEFVAESFEQHCVSEAECKAVAQLAELVKAHPEISFGDALGRLLVIYRMRVAELERQKERHTVQHASTLLGSITKAGGAYDLVKSIPTVFCFPDAADAAVTTMVNKLSIKEWKIRANIIDAMSHLAPFLSKQKVNELFSLMLETVDCNINRSRYSAARVLIRLSIHHHEYIDTMLVAVSNNRHENRPYYLIAVECLSELWRVDNSVDKKALFTTHINTDTASAKVRNMLLSSLLHESLPLYVDQLSKNCQQRVIELAADNLPVSDRFIRKHFNKFPVQCAVFAIRLLCKIATTPNYKNRRNFAVQPLNDLLSKLPAVSELKLDFESNQLSIVQCLTTVSDNQPVNEVQIRLLLVLLPYISNNCTVVILKFLTSDKIDVVRRTFADFVALANEVCTRIADETVDLEAILSQLAANMTGNSSRHCKYFAIQTIASLLRIKPQLSTPDILTSLLTFVHCKLDTVTTLYTPHYTNAVSINVHKHTQEIRITFHREDSKCVTDQLSEGLKETVMFANMQFATGYLYNNNLNLNLSQEHLTELATLRSRSLLDSTEKNVFHEQHITAVQTAVATIVQLLPLLPDQEFLSAFKIVFTSTVLIPLSSNNNVTMTVETVLSSIPETKILHVIDFLVLRAERAKGSAVERKQAVTWLRTLHSTRNAVVTSVVDSLLTGSEDEVLREFGCVVLKLMQNDVCI